MPKSKLTPTTRSIRLLEGRGYRVDIVERKVTRTVAKDLFGFIDVLAIKGPETLAVQVTSGSNVAARIKKIESMPDELSDVRDAGWSIHVHGWRQNAAGEWVCREVDLS